MFCFYCLGHTGFRFPVAHHPSRGGVKATDLHAILWDTILALKQWGFSCDYILQDGGRENRLFMKDSFPRTTTPLEENFTIPNPTDPDWQVF